MTEELEDLLVDIGHVEWKQVQQYRAHVDPYTAEVTYAGGMWTWIVYCYRLADPHATKGSAPTLALAHIQAEEAMRQRAMADAEANKEFCKLPGI